MTISEPANDNHEPFDPTKWLPFTHVLTQRQRPPTIGQSWFRINEAHLWAPTMLEIKPANRNKRRSRYNRWS